MSDNETTFTCEVDNITLNERKINENSAQRFSLTTEQEVDELVSNAQAQSTKIKTSYAVNIFKGTFVYTIVYLITTFSIHKYNNKANL